MQQKIDEKTIKKQIKDLQEQLKQASVEWIKIYLQKQITQLELKLNKGSHP